MILDFFSKHKLSRNYDGRCGNCHTPFDSTDDEFCRYCGTKRGEGKFLPYENFQGCVYGPPPVKRTHTCDNCGYSWDTRRMIDRSGYCPRCGGTISTVKSDHE
ncbi:MAG: hypothetical protein IKR23_08845 [Lachnospiraceae bacterium]|nr:hypothetical protein [Lachnospiraceae bacterium]